MILVVSVTGRGSIPRNATPILTQLANWNPWFSQGFHEPTRNDNILWLKKSPTQPSQQFLIKLENNKQKLRTVSALCFVWSKSKRPISNIQENCPLVMICFSPDPRKTCFYLQSITWGWWEFHPTKRNNHCQKHNKECCKRKSVTDYKKNEDYPIGEQKNKKKHLRLNKFKIRNEKWKNTEHWKTPFHPF